MKIDKDMYPQRLGLKAITVLCFQLVVKIPFWVTKLAKITIPMVKTNAKK